MSTGVKPAAQAHLVCCFRFPPGESSKVVMATHPAARTRSTSLVMEVVLKLSQALSPNPEILHEPKSEAAFQKQWGNELWAHPGTWLACGSSALHFLAHMGNNKCSVCVG